jgi:hypothetical protein
VAWVAGITAQLGRTGALNHKMVAQGITKWSRRAVPAKGRRLFQMHSSQEHMPCVVARESTLVSKVAITSFAAA